MRRALREFLAGPGRREEFEALLEQAREDYAVALDKLADLWKGAVRVRYLTVGEVAETNERLLEAGRETGQSK